MTKLFTSVAVFALSTSATFAGGYVAAVPSAPPAKTASVAAYDWSGAYGGLSYGTQRTRAQRAVYEDRDLTETHRETRPFSKRDLHEHLQTAGCEPGQTFAIAYPAQESLTSCESVRDNAPDAGWDDAFVEGFDPVVTREWEEVVGSETVQVGTETFRQSDSTAGVFLGVRHQFANRLVGGVEAQVAKVGDDTSIRALGQLGIGMGRFLPYATAGYDFEADTAVYGAGVDVAITPRVLGGLLYTQDPDGDAKRLEARVGFRF